ncbi:MAG: outer membrane beta-barrel protein, partial [Bacteroidales bacterium]
MKQFDEEFSRKAKEAFENYDASHLAEAGWNSYTKKYGKRRIRAFVIPLWARVASVAAILTIVVLLTNRINHGQADEPGSQLAQENRSELTEPAINNREDTVAANPEITVIKAVTPSASPDQAFEPTVSKPGQSRHEGREKTDYQVGEPAGQVLAETVKAERSSLPENLKAAGSLLTETAIAEGPILAVTAMDERSLLAETSKVAEMSPEMNLPDNPIEIRLTDDDDVILKLKPGELHPVLADIPRERMTTTLMTGLSGMMASIDNATSTSQGVSIGFYVEQQLTRRISVRPGLAMAKHNYGMESASGGSVALDYTAPELDGLSGITTSYEANIEVLSMEVPVNFVFSLRKRSGTNLFVSTGASTVIYLNQHLSGNFNNTYTRSTVDNNTGEVLYESRTISVMIESEQEPLNRVDFLGLANFSAGYSLPFSKTSHILFEPFVQLPLKDLTSMNLRIRYSTYSITLQEGVT